MNELDVLLEAEVKIGQAIGSALDAVINWFIEKIKWLTNKIAAIGKKIAKTLAQPFKGKEDAVASHDIYIQINGKRILAGRKGSKVRKEASGVRAKLEKLNNDVRKKGREAIGAAKAGIAVAKIAKKKKDNTKNKDISDKKEKVLNTIKNIGTVAGTIISLITLYSMYVSMT